MTEPITHFGGKHRFLSNFERCVVKWGYYLYPTVEHAYQAAKCVRADQAEAIRLAETPGQAKRLGRAVELRADWETVKLSVMRNLVTQKFTDVVLAERLLATGDAPLIEGNGWGDEFWGVDDRSQQGQNWLGIILMETRAALRGSQ